MTRGFPQEALSRVEARDEEPALRKLGSVMRRPATEIQRPLPRR
jgi:hypothetical protein